MKIATHKIDLSNVTSKCGSKDNIQHTPRGGAKKIENKKLEWKAESKVGSMDNARHKPGGGEKKIESKKLDWNVTSKVGSLDNAQHKPGGGEKKVSNQHVPHCDVTGATVTSSSDVTGRTHGQSMPPVKYTGRCLKGV